MGEKIIKIEHYILKLFEKENFTTLI